MAVINASHPTLVDVCWKEGTLVTQSDKWVPFEVVDGSRVKGIIPGTFLRVPPATAREVAEKAWAKLADPQPVFAPYSVESRHAVVGRWGFGGGGRSARA